MGPTKPVNCTGACADLPIATPYDWAAMTFEPIIIKPSVFGPAWDKTRGDLARAVISLLSHDDKELTRRCTADEEALAAAAQMYEEIEKESYYLKTHLAFLETASTRLLCVTARYEVEHGGLLTAERPQAPVPPAGGAQ